MSTSVYILPIHADHIPAIAKLERECFSRPWSERMLSEELENQTITLSNYVGASVENSITDLSWRGFTYEIIGDGDTVTAQVPEAGSQIAKDEGRLVLYTGSETPKNNIVVPDLTGMTAYNANKALINAGLNASFEGSLNGSTATVISQTPTGGTSVSKGTVVQVTLRHLDLTD